MRTVNLSNRHFSRRRVRAGCGREIKIVKTSGKPVCSGFNQRSSESSLKPPAESAALRPQTFHESHSEEVQRECHWSVCWNLGEKLNQDRVPLREVETCLQPESLGEHWHSSKWHAYSWGLQKDPSEVWPPSVTWPPEGTAERSDRHLGSDVECRGFNKHSGDAAAVRLYTPPPLPTSTVSPCLVPSVSLADRVCPACFPSLSLCSFLFCLPFDGHCPKHEVAWFVAPQCLCLLRFAHIILSHLLTSPSFSL